MKKYILIALCCFHLSGLTSAQTWQQHLYRANIEFTDLHFLDASTGFVFGDSVIGGTMITGVVLKTVDGGTNWTTCTLGNSNYRTTKAFVLNANELFSAGRNGGGNDGLFIKSTDGGATWTTPVNFTERLFNVCFINSSTGWVMGKNGLLSKTTDGGVNWTPQNVTTEDLLCMKFYGNGTTGILGCGGGELYRTVDGGNTWVPVSSNVPDGLLAVDIVGSDAWFSGEAGTIIHSSDYGQTWTVQNATVPIDFGAISFATNTNGWMAGLAGMLNATIDGGSSWNYQVSGSFLDITGLSVPDVNHGWLCNTDGQIFNFNTATSLFNLSDDAPGLLVSPNPATHFITVSGNANADVKLNVVNENGQVVKTFIQLQQSAINLDVSDLPKGIYYLVPFNRVHEKWRATASFIKL